MGLPDVVRRSILAACALLLACSAPSSEAEPANEAGATTTAGAGAGRGAPVARDETLTDRGTGDPGAARSAGAFARVAAVLRHPRCLNCHTATGFPRTGDLRQRHAMNVQRGADDHGRPGMRCSACHRDENQDLAGVPGAPHWGLAPLSMAWEGLDDHGLAESLKDRTRNGDRSLDAMLAHMADDPLVGWAWDPGAGRAPPPLSREDVVAAFAAWIETGAPSPPPGTTSTF